MACGPPGQRSLPPRHRDSEMRAINFIPHSLSYVKHSLLKSRQVSQENPKSALRNIWNCVRLIHQPGQQQDESVQWCVRRKACLLPTHSGEAAPLCREAQGPTYAAASQGFVYIFRNAVRYSGACLLSELLGQVISRLELHLDEGNVSWVAWFVAHHAGPGICVAHITRVDLGVEMEGGLKESTSTF